MDKLDRLGWAAETRLVSHGLRIAVRANSADALGRAHAHLPPSWRPCRSEVVDRLYSIRAATPSQRVGARGYHLVYAGAARVARSLDLDEAYSLFESDLHLYVAEKAQRRIFVHAGVVGWNGQAIVIPGRSFSGKSTLVAELVKAGGSYYSDEFAVFDERGRVHPFPRPLSLRQGEDRPALRCPVEDIGGARGTKPLPVGMVLVSQYRDGGEWRPRKLSPSQAVLALLANTVPARERPAASLTTLAQVVQGAVSYKGTRGEAQAMVNTLLRKRLLDSGVGSAYRLGKVNV